MDRRDCGKGDVVTQVRPRIDGLQLRGKQGITGMHGGQGLQMPQVTFSKGGMQQSTPPTHLFQLRAACSPPPFFKKVENGQPSDQHKIAVPVSTILKVIA